ncbi:GAF domain-containing protein [Mycobacterium camsae]|uniref:GAF domain-containing protein n=1 Tax=Mycobacterium gordonae TaxID=1778 RepID=UPI001981D946|nr:GAF domain-containing protein [Mycobacterium gordonae]
MDDVYRAPLRSRSDAIDQRATLQRARRLGLCGFGQLVHNPAAEERLARRVDRFAAAEDGSFAWTRDQDGLFWLARLDGPYLRDDEDEAVAVDLVHVRPCTWLTEPLLESQVPGAVVVTFGRGGRNFQQIHHQSVSQETQQIWDAQQARR